MTMIFFSKALINVDNQTDFMTNEIRSDKVVVLVKPEANLPGKKETEVQSLCNPYNVSCGNGFSVTCTPTFSSTGKDNDILF